MVSKAPEDKFITLSADMTEISVNAVRSAIVSIKDKKDKDCERNVYYDITIVFRKW